MGVGRLPEVDMPASDDAIVEAYQDLARYMVGSLLEDDIDFRIETEVYGPNIGINVFVPANERGKVIGRGGRIARSMRTLIDTATLDTYRRVSVDIVD